MGPGATSLLGPLNYGDKTNNFLLLEHDKSLMLGHLGNLYFNRDFPYGSACNRSRHGLPLIVTAAKGKVTSYNLPTRQQNKTVKYLGFTFGQTGDFFGSADIYVYFQALPGGKKAIQWRAFDSVKSWQGEIKGSSAAGGKIGGGGTNYYCEKHFDSSIGTSTNKHGKWQETTKPDWKI